MPPATKPFCIATDRPFRITIEKRRSDGSYEVCALEHMTEEAGLLFDLIFQALGRGISEGRVDPGYLESCAAGWLGLDPDAYSQLSPLEKGAVLYSASGGEWAAPAGQVN